MSVLIAVALFVAIEPCDRTLSVWMNRSTQVLPVKPICRRSTQVLPAPYASFPSWQKSTIGTFPEMGIDFRIDLAEGIYSEVPEGTVLGTARYRIRRQRQRRCPCLRIPIMYPDAAR
jgi:hypothetical protein